MPKTTSNLDPAQTIQSLCIQLFTTAQHMKLLAKDSGMLELEGLSQQCNDHISTLRGLEEALEDN